MKNILLKILFLLFLNISFAQTKSLSEMVKEISKPNIEISDLERYVSDNLSSQKQIAEFFYFWISSNISYDFEKLSRNGISRPSDAEILDNENPNIVFNERKGVCIGFASLFKLYMDKFGIECEIITGYAKTAENLTLELEIDEGYRHAWNAVKIDEKWLLIDVTWSGQFKNHGSNYYFNTPPKEFIFTHYPTDRKWQLLESYLSISDFNKLPFVDSSYFDAGFPTLPVLSSDDEFYYFEVPNNPTKGWLIKLTYSIGNIDDNSVFPKLIEKSSSFVYKFRKDLIPTNTTLNVTVTDFNQQRQSMVHYVNSIIYKL
jgi:transglutaminase/protease-like cytokinesis protein 3